MTGLLVIATAFFLATSCLTVGGSSICVNDSTSLGDVLLVGKYIKMDSIQEQVSACKFFYIVSLTNVYNS